MTGNTNASQNAEETQRVGYESEVEVLDATADHLRHLPRIQELMLQAARGGSAIAVRSIESLGQKIRAGDAVIALTPGGIPVGFMFLSPWEDGRFVSHSGLVVDPRCRGNGVARKLKRRIFELSRLKHPRARIFSLSTSSAVIAMNRGLGFRRVRYDEITGSEAFWKGCESCSFHADLRRNNRKKCRCTATAHDPVDDAPE